MDKEGGNNAGRSVDDDGVVAEEEREVSDQLDDYSIANGTHFSFC